MSIDIHNLAKKPLQAGQVDKNTVKLEKLKILEKLKKTVIYVEIGRV